MTSVPLCFKIKGRHPWRFSLRLLMVSITAICVALGILLYRARVQEQSVLAMEKVFGRVGYDYHLTQPGGILLHTKSPLPTWLVQGSGKHVFHTAVFLDLDSPSATDETLKHLGGLRSLEILHMPNSTATDDGAISLRQLKSLRRATLSSGMGDRALEHLAECPSLEEIDAYGDKVTDAGIMHLKKLRNLRLLCLHKTKVTEAGAMRLQKALPNCDVIY